MSGYYHKLIVEVREDFCLKNPKVYVREKNFFTSFYIILSPH